MVKEHELLLMGTSMLGNGRMEKKMEMEKLTFIFLAKYELIGRS